MSLGLHQKEVFSLIDLRASWACNKSMQHSHAAVVLGMLWGCLWSCNVKSTKALCLHADRLGLQCLHGIVHSFSDFLCAFIINTYYTVWSQFDTQLEYAERVDRIGTSSSAIPAAWWRGFCFKMVLDSSICHTNGAFWHCHGWTGRRDARAYENDMKRVELHRILASSM